MPLRSSNGRSTGRKVSGIWAGAFETLERRQLLSSATISYSDFASTTGLTANGFGNSAPNNGGQLVMTESQQNEARSVFYNTPVPVDHFTTHFAYRADDGAQADGFTFALQENGPTAVGNVGGSLGYQGMGGNGVAFGFSLLGNVYRIYSGDSLVDQEGNRSRPAPPPVGNGDTYDFTITYDGTTLSTSIVDENNSSNDYTHSFAINLDSALNAHSAYVGFTAGDGSLVSTQRILNWDYSGSAGPTISTAAAGTPSTVTATSTALSVDATDTTDVGALTYNWTVLHKPSGAATPTFTNNDSTSANDTTAHFYKDGTYIFRATASDTDDLLDVSDVAVVVHQTATAVRITPHAQSIARKTKKTFTATVTDQFGHALRTQPAIAWSLLQGGGGIGASTGVFTAGSQSGHVVIQATDMLDTLTGTSGAVVV